MQKAPERTRIDVVSVHYAIMYVRATKTTLTNDIENSRYHKPSAFPNQALPSVDTSGTVAC